MKHYYTGSDGSVNCLEHKSHKYIKREWVNGKWRYFYKDDSVTEAEKKATQARDSADSAKKAYEAMKARNDRRIDELNKTHNEKYGDQAGNDENWPKIFDQTKPLMEATNKAYRSAVESYKKANQAELEYKVANKDYKISSGHKVADILNDASDLIDKSKDWVEKLLKKKKK